MKKYIDADKLKAKLKREIHTLTLSIQSQGDYGQSCHINAYENIISIIDSLLQEQPKKSQKDCNDCPHCVDRKDQYGWHFKGCFGGPYNGKFIAEIEECPLQQEQPKVDLEEEIHRIIRSYFKNPDYDGDFIAEVDWEKSMNECARHFYELGLNTNKEE